MHREIDIISMEVLIDVVDTLRVEQARAPLDTMNAIPLFEQEFREVRTVLSGNPRNKRDFFRHSGRFPVKTIVRVKARSL